MRALTIGFAILVAAGVAGAQGSQDKTKPIHHFVFFGGDRTSIHSDSLFLDTQSIEGAQIRYLWRSLEPSKDHYDFSEIKEDLAFLKSHNKKLWIQLADISFIPTRMPVPQYLVSDSSYHGGAAKTYNDQDESKIEQSGWVARRWDPAVRERFQKLLIALGADLDGRIEGINLPETALDVDSSGIVPPGYSIDNYREGIGQNMRALKLAFPKSVAMQYANFIRGEWRPSEDKHYLFGVYVLAQQLGVGVGGPDLMPYKRAQLGNSYPLIREAANKIPIGIAVQDGNLAEINPDTKAKVTATELLDFAMNNLRVDYIFWGREEPYYSKEVIPLLRKGDSRSHH